MQKLGKKGYFYEPLVDAYGDRLNIASKKKILIGTKVEMNINLLRFQLRGSHASVRRHVGAKLPILPFFGFLPPPPPPPQPPLRGLGGGHYGMSMALGGVAQDHLLSSLIRQMGKFF